MRKPCILVFGVSFIFVSAMQAETQMDFLGFDDSGNPAYAINGSEHGHFDLYLQCLSPDASVWQGDGDVLVTDLGITHEQNHLFGIRGIDGSPFFISPDVWPSAVEVFDLSMSRVGVHAYYLEPFFRADAGGPYSIAAGQSVMLDSSGSYLAMEYGWNPAASLQLPDIVQVRDWTIDGKSVGPLVSFADLVGTLGLSYGIHTLQIDATAFDEEGYTWDGSAFSTIEIIIPEPATVLLFGLGAVLLRGRRRV